MHRWLVTTIAIIGVLLGYMVLWSQEGTTKTMDYRIERDNWPLGLKLNEIFYSPGSLRLHHQKRDINCSSCHSPWKSVKNEYCYRCHIWADPENKLKKGPQGMPKKQVAKDVITAHHIFADRPCWECHSEHKGELTVSEDGFEHDLEKESLNSNCKHCHAEKGKEAHPDLMVRNCVECHEPGKWDETNFSHGNLPSKDKKACRECHKNGTGHGASTAGFECMVCHDKDGRLIGDFGEKNN